MANEFDPIIGNWYRHLDKGQMFQVIAIDDEERLVELQHFDGDIEELSMVAWRAMDLELTEAPEDWTGPLDDIEPDDLGYSSETAMSRSDWVRPLQETPGDEHEAWEDTDTTKASAGTDSDESVEELWEPEKIDAVDSDSIA